VHLAFPSDSKTARLSRLMIAGAAAVGVGLFALNAPTATGPLVQHHDVKLVATDEVDWAQFFTNTGDSLKDLFGAQGEAYTAGKDLTTALGSVGEHFGSQITTAITGFDTGVNNALFGGWYGSDDGYVFGLFGGEPVSGGPTPGITGSLLDVLHTDFAAGNAEQAYSDFNNYTLEVLDHTLKPLLAPLLDETSKGVTTLSIPVELSQIQTNLLETFGNYTELKGVAETILSPEISGFFVLTQDLDAIQAAMQLGDSATAMTDVKDLVPDVLNAFVNGWVPPAGAEGDLFPGLIGSGSFLDELFTTWTQQFIEAFGTLAGESATAGASEAVTTALPDLAAAALGGL
jgi:hypothetical protein